MSARFAIFLGILSVLFVYTWFFWGPELSITVFALMIGSQFLYRSEKYNPGTFISLVIGWAGTLCMGFWATLVLLSIPASIISLLVPDIDTRPWVLGGTIAITILGLIRVNMGPKVVHVSGTSTLNLPPEITGLKIAQVSDLHIGTTIRRGYVESVVEKVMALEPDLIAITGDLADGEPEQLEEGLQPLTQLKAKLGVYYVTGNHEYYWDAEKWIKKAPELGLIPLVNEHRIVTFNGVKLLIGGVTDTSAEDFIPAQKSSPEKAIVSIENPRFKILLAHRPDSCEEADRVGFNFQLSGHTHAGQFFPFNLIVKQVHRYNHGLHRHGSLTLYVSAGTGYWGPPNRFGVPAEITLITF